jgi:predicted transcriptional regulator
VFNLIPGLPLDGGRMLRAVVWWFTGSYERGTTAASFVGQVLAILLVMSGIAVTLDGDVGGLFLAALGYYLFVRARAGMAEVALRRALNGLTVRSLWLETLPQVARDVTVGEFIRNLAADEVSADPHFMVVDDGVIWGLMPASAALGADARAWESLTVGDVMTPIDKIEKLSYQTEVLRAMEAIYASNVSELPVIDDNVVQGFVGRDALLRFVASRLALYGGQTT